MLASRVHACFIGTLELTDMSVITRHIPPATGSDVLWNTML